MRLVRTSRKTQVQYCKVKNDYIFYLYNKNIYSDLMEVLLLSLVKKKLFFNRLSNYTKSTCQGISITFEL